MEGRARRKNRVIVHVTKQINGGMVRKRFFVYRPRFCGGENKDKKKQRGRHILTENNTSESGINPEYLKRYFQFDLKTFFQAVFTRPQGLEKSVMRLEYGQRVVMEQHV